MAELDAPWAGYVEGVERLARPDADNALRELEAKVSEAILHALENQVILENKVSNNITNFILVSTQDGGFGQIKWMYTI